MDRATFAQLFEEFALAYLTSDAGKTHAAMFRAEREQAAVNYAALMAAAEREEDVTDPVLLQLLPHSNTQAHRDNGVWISHAPAIAGNIKPWFENVGWADPQTWPAIARAILGFVRRCVTQPAELREACEEFAQLPYTRGFQSGMLSPILNALRPDAFVLINSKSRPLINQLAGTSYSNQLSEDDIPAPRVLRGGSWSGHAQFARGASRGGLGPHDRGHGFRLVALAPAVEALDSGALDSGL